MAKHLAFLFISVLLSITLCAGQTLAAAPIAIAGGDQYAFEDETVTLNGTASSDEEGGTLTYHWEQVIVGSEPSVELTDSDTALPTFTMPAWRTEGGNQLTFSLVVTDEEGLQDQDEVIVNNAAQIDCNVAEGFQFTGNTGTIGYLTGLQIGDTVLTADPEFADAENPTDDPLTVDETSDVVGILESINWNNKQDAPLKFTARLSEANKDAVLKELEEIAENTRVLLKYVIYQYDATSETYFKSFHTNSVTIAGLIDAVDQISMEQTPASDVPDPVNYALTLNLAADNLTPHQLHRMDALGLTLIWSWGDGEGDGPNLAPSSEKINFGIVERGKSQSQILTIVNNGSSDLHIGKVGGAIPIKAPFRLDEATDSCSDRILGVGGDCSITVTLDASLIAVIVPATGAMGSLAAGLMFFGGPGRRKQIMTILMMLIAAGSLLACGSDRSWQTTTFDIPSNDTDRSKLVISVLADVEEE